MDKVSEPVLFGESLGFLPSDLIIGATLRILRSSQGDYTPFGRTAWLEVFSGSAAVGPTIPGRDSAPQGTTELVETTNRPSWPPLPSLGPRPGSCPLLPNPPPAHPVNSLIVSLRACSALRRPHSTDSRSQKLWDIPQAPIPEMFILWVEGEKAKREMLQFTPSTSGASSGKEEGRARGGTP